MIEGSGDLKPFQEAATKMPPIYKPVDFVYTCEVCGSRLDKDEIMETRIVKKASKDWEPCYDKEGIGHWHDKWTLGTVLLHCENGHKTQQPYQTACSCGWDSRMA